MQMTNEIMPDNEAVLSFLKMVYPDGPWLLSAIRPDRKSIDTKTFHPESEAELRAWLQLHNGERNCYWSVNPPSRDLSKKAEREDIKEVCYFQVDIDPRAGEDLVDEQARCVALLMTKLPADVPLPTF